MKNVLWLIPALACVAGCSDVEDEGGEIPTQVATETSRRREIRNNPLPSESGTAGFAIPDASAGGVEEDPAVREFGGELRLAIPSSWTDVEMSAMQRSVLMGKFQVPDVHPRIEITVSAAGGGIDANFERWSGQFAGGTDDQDNIDFGSATARVLQLTGDFTPGFGKPNGTNFALLGAAFPADGRDFYLKLTGPADKVKEMDADFRKMVRTATLRP